MDSPLLNVDFEVRCIMLHSKIYGKLTFSQNDRNLNIISVYILVAHVQYINIVTKQSIHVYIQLNTSYHRLLTGDSSRDGDMYQNGGVDTTRSHGLLAVKHVSKLGGKRRVLHSIS